MLLLHLTLISISDESPFSPLRKAQNGSHSGFLGKTFPAPQIRANEAKLNDGKSNLGREGGDSTNKCSGTKKFFLPFPPPFHSVTRRRGRRRSRRSLRCPGSGMRCNLHTEATRQKCSSMLTLLSSLSCSFDADRGPSPKPTGALLDHVSIMYMKTVFLIELARAPGVARGKNPRSASKGVPSY